jgi:hypothetical protein
MAKKSNAKHVFKARNTGLLNEVISIDDANDEVIKSYCLVDEEFDEDDVPLAGFRADDEDGLEKLYLKITGLAA